MNPSDQTAARVLVLVLVVFLLKLAWSASSLGSTDAVRFYKFGRQLAAQPLREVYANDLRYNHTPAVSVYLATIARATGDDVQAFVFWLRLPGILADVAVIIELLLLRRVLGLGSGWLVLAALSPVNFIISGFHGNFDSVLAAGIFLAFTAALRGRPVLSGCWLGLACQVKVVPLLFAPALAAFWFHRGGLAGFSVAFGGGLLALLGPGLLLGGPKFLTNVLAYGSLWGTWGVPQVLRVSGWAPAREVIAFHFNAGQQAVAMTLKALIVAAALALAWLRRRADARGVVETGALTWLVFFTLTPGFGHQYLVWWLPLVLAVAPRWAAVLLAGSSAALVSAFAAWSAEPFPWRIVMPERGENATMLALSIAAWALFTAATVVLLWRSFRPALSTSSDDAIR
jgi:uncharacterized membrane protein